MKEAYDEKVFFNWKIANETSVKNYAFPAEETIGWGDKLPPNCTVPGVELRSTRLLNLALVFLRTEF